MFYHVNCAIIFHFSIFDCISTIFINYFLLPVGAAVFQYHYFCFAIIRSTVCSNLLYSCFFLTCTCQSHTAKHMALFFFSKNILHWMIFVHENDRGTKERTNPVGYFSANWSRTKWLIYIDILIMITQHATHMSAHCFSRIYFHGSMLGREKDRKNMVYMVYMVLAFSEFHDQCYFNDWTHVTDILIVCDTIQIIIYFWDESVHYSW
jgi:hypothetical protein